MKDLKIHPMPVLILRIFRGVDLPLVEKCKKVDISINVELVFSR